MNRFQKVVLYGALLDVFALFMFPPYDRAGFGREAPVFDAFYPLVAAPANRVISGDLLYVLLFGVLINAALAWLLLASPKATPTESRFDAQTLVALFAILNLALVMLFPPMEAFAFAQRITVGTFDGFYFAFGDKSRRAIFVPLLYMEVLFVLINAFAFWLAMGVAARNGPRQSGPMTMLAQSDALREQAQARLVGGMTPAPSVSTRGPDRRRRPDPGYAGPERRKRSERRRRAA